MKEQRTLVLILYRLKAAATGRPSASALHSERYIFVILLCHRRPYELSRAALRACLSAIA